MIEIPKAECISTLPLQQQHQRLGRVVNVAMLGLIAHIDTLCRDHGIEIDLRSRTSAVSIQSRRRWATADFKPTRRIRIPVITMLSRYFVALHEIGHIVGQQPRTRLEREYAAWRWALDNAATHPDESVWLDLHAALRTHIEWAKARQYRQHGRPVIPPRTHPLWALMAHAKANF